MNGATVLSSLGASRRPPSFGVITQQASGRPGMLRRPSPSCSEDAFSSRVGSLSRLW
jgi:hypothetical protein